MAQIQLDRHDAERLGRLHHKRLAVVPSVPDWEMPDWPPDRTCLDHARCWVGLFVTELVAPYRSGQVASYRKIHGYDKPLPVVQWDTGCKGISHPNLLWLQPVPQPPRPRPARLLRLVGMPNLEKSSKPARAARRRRGSCEDWEQLSLF